tara:strand:- start:181 stop:699 length:519 start_codon:yes stop_codon:yes gene_type:complete
MCRYYYGAIEGKFWFAIQHSSMIENYGGWINHDQKNWCGCDCQVDVDDDTYCSDCYKSFDDHKQAVLEDDIQHEENGSIPTYEECFPDMEITREDFEKTVLPFVSEKESLCKEWLEEFEISDEEGHEYDVSIKKDCPEEYLSTIADWCMLKQIQKYFDNNPEADECQFRGEI